MISREMRNIWSDAIKKKRARGIGKVLRMVQKRDAVYTAVPYVWKYLIPKAE